MTSKLPVTFKGAPLPVGFQGTPQQFEDALVARLSIESEEQFALFVVGDTAPTSNVGPWLKGGLVWYVWDPTTGSYIPEPKVPNFPFRGDLTADQDVVFGAALTISTDAVFTQTFDPNNVFGGSLFSAPVDGLYAINASIRMSILTPTPTPTLLQAQLKKNSFSMANDLANIGTLSGTQTGTVQINTVLSLLAGDAIGVFTTITTGAAGTIRLNKLGSFFCGYRVQ